MAIERGCGTRVAGGIYAESKLSAEGKPLEFFLIDPPLPVDPTLGLSAIGVKLAQFADVWHVFDWVGSKHYLNVADFLEEARRHGLSRRLPKTLDFSKLTDKSNVTLVHHRAIIQDPAPYHTDRRQVARLTDNFRAGWCPKEHPYHEAAAVPGAKFPAMINGQPGHIVSLTPPMCAGLWWEDVEIPLNGGWIQNDRIVRRAMPGFEYDAWRKPDGERPAHIPGFFASFPITNLAVIRNREDEKDHLQALDRASRAGLHVTLEDE